ncbi:MAG: IS200/IS605 family transposase [Muribaculaceae bacterium]|nr:IS200/IS605 family transposase [Muribaculaceae bacterium]
MSFTQLFYHIVFATKNRANTIIAERERDVYRMIYHISKRHGAEIIRIGGMPDHIHILTIVPPTISVGDYVKSVKRESSLMIGMGHVLPVWDGWQNGYGCFTYSNKDIPTVRKYIVNQKEHHRNRTFAEEYRAILLEAGVSEDGPYFPK